MYSQIADLSLVISGLLSSPAHLETSSHSCFYFPNTLTDCQLCLITVLTPGGWSRPLGRVPMVLGPVQTQGNGFSHEKTDKTTSDTLFEYPAVLNVVSGLSSHQEPRETTPDPLGYCWKGPNGVGCSPDPLKYDFG